MCIRDSDNIGDFLYTDRFNIIISNNSLGTSFKSKGTKDITWETNTNFNIGAEFQLWKDVYKRQVLLCKKLMILSWQT